MRRRLQRQHDQPDAKDDNGEEHVEAGQLDMRRIALRIVGSKTYLRFPMLKILNFGAMICIEANDDSI